MLKRTFTGAAITVVVYLVVYFSHIPAVLPCATALLGAFAVYELYTAAKLEKKRWFLLVSIAAETGIILLPVTDYYKILEFVFPVAVICFGWMMARLDKIRMGPYQTSVVTLMVVLLLKAIPELRQIPNGLAYLVAAVTLCFVTDVAAFLVGSRFGRHKLLPRISPNKTVEGALAGVAAAVLGMIAYGALLSGFERYLVDYLPLCMYAALASVIAQFGDLAMSCVKRSCGVKDFGNLLPGHGGMLDRFDSHMFCLAFTLLFCSLTGGFLR